MEVKLEQHAKDVEKARSFSSRDERSSSDGEQHQSIATDRPRCMVKPLTRYGFKDLASFVLTVSYGDPITFQKVINSEDKDKWLGARVEEIEALHKNKTWELVKLSKEK